MATRTNRAVGAGFSAGPISGSQLIYALGALGAWIMVYAFFRPPAIQSIVLFATIFAIWAALTNKDPGAFWDSFRGTRKWITASPQHRLNGAGIPSLPKMERHMTFKRGKQRQTFWALEPEFHLNTYGAFLHGLGDNPSQELIDRAPGFLVCSKGPAIRITCAWELFGYSPSVNEDNCEEALQKLAAAISQIPDCTMRFIFQSSDGGHVFTQEMDRLLKGRDRDRLEYLMLRGERQTYEKMSKAGRIQQKRIFVYATFSAMGGASGVPEGIVEVLLARISPILNSISGEASQDAWSSAMRTAWGFGIEPFNKVLKARTEFGLAARQLSWSEMWASDWYELHNDVPPLPPQLLLVDERGIRDLIVNSQDHALSVLFQPENAQPSVPQIGKHVLYRPVKNDYQGFLRIGKVQTYPSKDGKALGKLKFIWNALEQAPNCKYIVDITPDKSGLEKHFIDMGLTNSVKRMARAAKKGTVDVSADKKRDFSVAALDAADEGEGFYLASGGVWVTRDSIEEVEEALAQVTTKLKASARVVREIDLTEFLWMQSQNYTWNRLLETPSFRREKYQLSDLLGLIPLIRVAPMDTRGIPLLSRDGTPLLLDMVHGKQHLMLMATTRGGKSVVLAREVWSYYLERSPVLVLDFPPPDGESTFTDICKLIGDSGGKATYFNVRNECMNVLERPDIEPFKNNQKRYEASLATIESFHLDILKLLTVGVERDTLSGLCDSIVGQVYAAFQSDSAIRRKYDIAVSAGYGNSGYEQMPTLADDFLPFVERWAKDYIDNSLMKSSRSLDAIDYILTQLRGVVTSSLGRSIAYSSTVDPEADLLVMALENADEGFESAVYAMAAYGFVAFKSMAVKSSGFIIDEGVILFESPHFPKRCGQVAANGLKWGCHLTISSQNISAIARSASRDAILDNMKNIGVGYHLDSATDAFVKHAHLKPQVISPYASDLLKPNKQSFESYWYLKHGSRHIELKFCPSELLLAAVANNPEETAARRRFFDGYDDSAEAIYYFAQEYTYALKNDIPLDSIGRNFKPADSDRSTSVSTGQRSPEHHGSSTR